MIGIATSIGFFLLMLAFAMATFRLVKGPTLPDRVIALDLIGVISLGLVLLITLQSGEPVYLDVAVVLGIVAFMGTVAFARYLEGTTE